MNAALSAKRMTGSTVDMEEKGRGRTPSPSPLSGRPVTPGGTGADGYRPARAPSAMDDRDPRSSTPFEKARRTSGMFKRASRAPTILHRDAAITRSDLIASAERIFARYLVPGADKEVYLPPALRINDFPLSSHALPSPTSPAYETESAALAQVPDMFHNQKEYVFRAMEQDAFPRFLRAKAFGNLTPVSALVRLCVGLLVLWIALACAFALVFLDVKPKSKRFFVSTLPLCYDPPVCLRRSPFSYLYHSLSLSCYSFLTNTNSTLFSSSYNNLKPPPSELCASVSDMSGICFSVAQHGSAF